MNLACLVALTCVLPVLAFAAPLDTAKIEESTGLKGTMNEAEGVFKVSAPMMLHKPETLSGRRNTPIKQASSDSRRICLDQ